MDPVTDFQVPKRIEIKTIFDNFAESFIMSLFYLNITHTCYQVTFVLMIIHISISIRCM